MFRVNVLLTRSEWRRIQQAAAEQFPGEVLSRAEIMRRYTLAGIEAVAGKTEAERKKLADEYRVSMVRAGWTAEDLKGGNRD